MPRDDWRRYAAPAAFLLAATIAIVLIRAGLDSGHDHTTTSTVVVPSPPHKRVSTTSSKPKRSSTSTSVSTSTTTTTGQQFWTVQAGDTFSVIASKSGVPISTIEQLNPNASSTTLHIGEKIRIR